VDKLSFYETVELLIQSYSREEKAKDEVWP